MAAGLYFAWGMSKADYAYSHRSYEEKTNSKMVHFQSMEVSPSQLTTDRLQFGGVVLAFTDGKNNFLAHLLFSEITSEAMVQKIRENFNVDALKADPSFSIMMWQDPFLTKDRSLQTIKTAMDRLGLESKISNLTDDSILGPQSYLGVNVGGTFENQTGTRPTSATVPSA